MSVLEHRPELPPALAALVMRCLEKDEAKRPQSAAEVLQVLDAIGTPSGGGHDVRPAIARSTRRSLARALGIWAVASVAVAIVAKAAVIAIGLPTWTFPGALLVMAAGLPVILLTSFAKHGAHVARTMVGVTPGGSAPAQSTWTRLAVRASPLVSWRRTWMGSAFALGAFVLIVAGYMALRLLGVGSVGSLFAKGVMKRSDKVVLADLQARGPDSTLGLAFSEALRTDLSQSRAIVLLPPSAIQSALQRMGRAPQTPLSTPLAREVAQREGATAVIDGDITPVGAGFLLTLRLVNPSTGDALASFRETAEDPRDVIAAMGRLSHDLRAKIGESLKSVQDGPALERVSTVSLDALRRYTEAVRARDVEENFDKATALLRQAIALDSTFAMAYRKLGAAYSGMGGHDADAAVALERAYDLRERLPPLERHVTAGTYFQVVAWDPAAAMSEFEAALAIEPANGVALIRLGNAYHAEGDHARALDAYERFAATVDSDMFGVLNAVVAEQFALSDTAATAAALRAFGRRQSGTQFLYGARFDYYYAIGQFDSARAQLAHLRSRRSKTIQDEIYANEMDGDLAIVQGRLREGYAARAAARAEARAAGNRLASFDSAISEADRNILVPGSS